MFPKQSMDPSKSLNVPLMSDFALGQQIAALRQHLSRDFWPDVRAGLNSPHVRASLDLPWWQRMQIPGTEYFTTSDHNRLEFSDPGFLNTLGGALTPQEGFLLRPMPKWAYLKPIMPYLTGKSVLEIGCNNGFFCFEFAQAAAKVTGAEVFDGFLRPARWMAAAKHTQNVEFLLTDALLDLTIPRHDVVFMSEVLGHLVDPLFGIARAVNLAKETLVIDNAALPSLECEIDVNAGHDPATGKMLYHAWVLSDGLMLAYLFLCGVPPERVKRYVAPWQNHTVYVIDTSGVPDYREANHFQPCNTSFINMRWRL